MNSPSEFPIANGSAASDAARALKDLDDTLRLLSKISVPAGLKDRVFSGVLAAPRSARVLEFPGPVYTREWMRGIAAAVIVLLVGGGGFGLYAHVEHDQPAQAVATPRTIMQPGEFSSAGVIRRPQTLTGPVLNKPASAAHQPQATAASEKLAVKPPVSPAKKASAKHPVHPAIHAPVRAVDVKSTHPAAAAK